MKNLKDCRPIHLPAAVELSLAALLREAGHTVRFHPPSRNGKSADLVAELGEEEVFFEVKILREAQINELLGEFTHGLGMCIDEFLRQNHGALAGLEWRVQLEPDIADTFSRKSKGDPDYGERLLQSTLRQVAEHLRQREYEFRIPEVGHFTFRPKESMADSGISHFPVSPRIELARILRSRLHDAIDQMLADNINQVRMNAISTRLQASPGTARAADLIEQLALTGRPVI